MPITNGYSETMQPPAEMPARTRPRPNLLAITTRDSHVLARILELERLVRALQRRG